MPETSVPEPNESEITRHASLCRFCHASCPIVVDMQDGLPVRVTGNHRSPTYHGFSCSRGRALPEHYTHPDRLLHSLARQPDGSHARISVEEAIDAIAEKLRVIVERHGPRAVAFYMGTYSGPYPAGSTLAGSLAAALQTPMVFSSSTIDQPGKDVANAMLGRWLAGPDAFDESDVCLIVGGNPIITMGGGIPNQNPGYRLNERLAAGMQLIVIDPRRSETASRAHVHLQARPGEDASLLASLVHVILREELGDAAFLREHVSGVEALRGAVAPFAPEVAAARADVPVEDLIRAARVFAGARKGLAIGSTGANMSGHSTLVEYLTLCLNTLCGRFVREGEAVANPGVLLPRATPRAQAEGPRPYRDLGDPLRVRGLGRNASGMPTAALADEILLEGEGQVRALISLGGNPMAAWPDQARTARALDALELLVQVDIRMSATAQVADYIIAPQITFEVPGISLAVEQVETYSVHWGLAEPFGMWAPRLLEPPPGSEVIEEWELFYGLAQRLDLPLNVGGIPSMSATEREPRPASAVDMQHKPTTEDLYELMTRGSRIPLEEVKRYPDGHLFSERIEALPAIPTTKERLDVGNPDMLIELGEVASEGAIAEREVGERPFLLVCRRHHHVYNSSGRDLPSLQRRKGAYNPAFMHPEDLDALGLRSGEAVDIRSRHGSIPGIVEADKTLRRGLVSMAHAYGNAPSRPAPVRDVGSNTSGLTSVDDDFDRYSGIPRMSAVPVSVRAVASV